LKRHTYSPRPVIASWTSATNLSRGPQPYHRAALQ
jgi:hypothetical protein